MNKSALNALIAEYANDFGTKLKDDLGRRDFSFLRELVAAAEGTPAYDTACHVYNAGRSLAVKAQGTERADWPWAYCGVQLVNPKTGAVLQAWPKSEDGKSTLCKPAALMDAIKTHGYGVLVWI